MSEESGSGMFQLQASGSTPKAEAQQVDTSIEAPSDSANNDMGQTAASYVETPTESKKELLAGKYETQDDLVKGYLELQQKFSEARPRTHDMTIENVMDAAGLKPDEVITNYNADGKLSDHQYSSLANIGFSRQVVDEYLEGRVAVAQNGEYAVDYMRRQAEQLAGGSEQLDGLLDWAGNRYAGDETMLNKINTRLQDPKEYQSVVKELMWDWKMETGRGSTHQLIQGDRMPETSAGFTSVGELVNALGKARETGSLDEATKRRIANTPKHILQGVDT